MKRVLFALLLSSSLARAAGVQRYNEPVPLSIGRPQLVERIDELAARLARDERRTVPRPDARLDAAAEDIARLMPERAAPANELVQGALWLHGIVEEPPHLVITAVETGTPDDEVMRSVTPELRTALTQGRFARIGVGLVATGRETRVLIALQESFIELEPLPRALPNGGPAPLRGELHPGFERPEAMVTAPDGTTTRVPLDGDAHRFAGTFRCGPKRGRYQIELVGEDRFGAAVLANFPVWCGVAPATTVQAASPSGGEREEPFTTTAQAEQAVFKLLNIDRAHAGLPALAWDERLAQVARAHSADMLAHNFFGHVSPTTGTTADRVRKANIDALVIQENVARASTPGEVERGLMNSPGHRANILSKVATRVGVGIVASESGGERELLVTQLFLKPPEAFSAHTEDDLRKQINAWRHQHKLGELVRDADLDHLAQLAVTEMVKSGLTADQAGRRIDNGLDGNHWSTARSAVAVVGSPTQVVDALRGLLADPSATHYGLGVLPGKRREGGSALYVILVLGAHR